MKQVFTKFVGKQQYLYIVLALIGMCFAGASVVLAQENTMDNQTSASYSGTTTIEDRQAAMEEKRAALELLKTERMKEIETKRTEIKVRMEERRAAFSSQMQERIRSLTGNLTERLQNAIDRFTAIIERFESRMTKLEERGIDTSEATVLVEEAKRKLSAASIILEGADTDVEYTVTSDNPRADWSGAKETFREVHGLIKESRELLRQALQTLKDAVGEPEPEGASTTEATTTDAAGT